MQGWERRKSGTNIEYESERKWEKRKISKFQKGEENEKRMEKMGKTK